MISGYMAHWWSTKYLEKYRLDIRDKKPITREEIWDQLVVDFWLTDEAEKRAVFDNDKKHQQLLDWIDAIVENRANENSEKRHVMEYFYRARILTLFPNSYDKYISIKQAENDEYLGQVDMSEKMRTVMESYGRKASPKKKDDNFTTLRSVFKDA